MSEMITRSSAAATTWALSTSLRLEKEGAEITREPVTDEDLAGPHGETWLEGSLRAGRLDVLLPDLETRVVPIAREDGRGFAGYSIEARDRDGHVSRSVFTLYSLGGVASRAAQRLIAEGRLKSDDLYYYEIAAREITSKDTAASVAEKLFTVERKREALEVLSVPLSSLMERARVVGTPGSAHPVFYTADALARAERISRRGASSHPPEETGGVLVGTLCSCPESREFFVVVAEVIEARDAEQSKFSLYYSARTWSRLQAVVGAMRAQPEMRTYRIIGQAHGHNFLPADGAPPCEACAKAEVCGRTTVFTSADDASWNRAVFAGQPWGLCHIYGLNARREEVQGLFGQRDGRLLERGYHVIPEFDPTEWID